MKRGDIFVDIKNFDLDGNPVRVEITAVRKGFVYYRCQGDTGPSEWKCPIHLWVEHYRRPRVSERLEDE